MRLARLSAFGLPDYEPWIEVASRQSKLIDLCRREPGSQSLGRGLERCSSQRCGRAVCSPVCPIGVHRLRSDIIPKMAVLLSAAAAPTYFVTAVRPEWAVIKLSDLDPSALVRWTMRRVQRRLSRGVVGLGAVEVTLNVELDQNATWAGHVHLILAGASEAELKSAFRFPSEGAKSAKPLRVDLVTCIGRQVGYMTKQLTTQRIAYIDANGRENRRHLPLSPTAAREHRDWLSRHCQSDFSFFIGCRRSGSKLVRLSAP